MVKYPTRLDQFLKSLWFLPIWRTDATGYLTESNFQKCHGQVHRSNMQHFIFLAVTKLSYLKNNQQSRNVLVHISIRRQASIMRILVSNAIALTLGVFCLLQSTVEGQLSTDPLLIPVDPLMNATDPTINAANVNLDPNIYYYKPPTTLPYPSQPQCSAPTCNTASCSAPQCYSVPPVYQSCPVPPVPPCAGNCGYNAGCGAYYNGGFNNGGYQYNNGGYNNGGYYSGGCSYNNGGYAYNNRGCNFNNGGFPYNNGGNCGPERGYYNYPQCSGYQNGGYPYQQGGYQY